MRHRLRISLGLKPLAAENESDKQRKAQQEREALKAEEERAQKAADLAERVKAYVPLPLLVSQYELIMLTQAACFVHDYHAGAQTAPPYLPCGHEATATETAAKCISTRIMWMPYPRASTKHADD